MTPLEITLWSVALAVGLLGQALGAGLEMGVYALDRIRLGLRAGLGFGEGSGEGASGVRAGADAAAVILRDELREPERVLTTLLVVCNAFGFLANLGSTALLQARGLTHSETLLVNVLILTPVSFVLCDTLPKELFRTETDRWTYVFAVPIRLARGVLTVTMVLPLLRWSAGVVARAAGLGTDVPLTETARERVAALVKEGAARGLLAESHASLVDRALMLRETRVMDEMVPWSRVRSIPGHVTPAEVLGFIAKEPFSQYPVVDRRGRVVGVLEEIDAYLRPDAPVAELMFEPARLPPNMPLTEAVLKFREAGTQVGIVERDGRPLGLLTIADLVEPLTGPLA